VRQVSAKRTTLFDCRHYLATLPSRRKCSPCHGRESTALALWERPLNRAWSHLASCSPKLDPIIGFSANIWLAMKSSKPREWTELEVKTLIFMSGQRLSAEEISKSLGRYVGSVKTKARELGLVAIKKRSKAHRWSATDDY
jgi:hypothetical protein